MKRLRTSADAHEKAKEPTNYKHMTGLFEGKFGEAAVVVGPVCQFDSQKMPKTFYPEFRMAVFGPTWCMHRPPNDPKGPA
jgi:hypothetical protein